MAFTPLSGKQSKCLINSKIYIANKWTVKFKGDKLDVSNFEGSGVYAYISGMKGVDVTIEADWDNTAGGAAGGNPFDSGGIYVVPGTTVATLVIYTSLSGSYWSITSFVVEDVTTTADVKGKVSFTMTGSGTGAFTIPSSTNSTTALP